MIIKKGKASKKSRETNYWTPEELYVFLTKKYRFEPNCDIAATEVNSLCDYYYDKQINALRVIRWHLPIKKRIKCWCNAPNDNIGNFLLEIYRQFRDFGIPTMMIVPSNVEGTKSFWKAVQDPIDRGEKIFYRPIKGRPIFKLRGKRTLDKTGKELSSINSYKVIIWGRRK